MRIKTFVPVLLIALAGCSVTVSDEPDSLELMDETWPDFRDEICPAVRDAVATGLLTRSQVISLVVAEGTKDSTLTTEEIAHIRSLVERDC